MAGLFLNAGVFASCGTLAPDKGPLEELTPIGPVRVRVRADLAEGAGAECVFSGQALEVETGDGFSEVCVERLVDYEIVRFTR